MREGIFVNRQEKCGPTLDVAPINHTRPLLPPPAADIPSFPPPATAAYIPRATTATVAFADSGLGKQWRSRPSCHSPRERSRLWASPPALPGPDPTASSWPTPSAPIPGRFSLRRIFLFFFVRLWVLLLHV